MFYLAFNPDNPDNIHKTLTVIFNVGSHIFAVPRVVIFHFFKQKLGESLQEVRRGVIEGNFYSSPFILDVYVQELQLLPHILFSLSLLLIHHPHVVLR